MDKRLAEHDVDMEQLERALLVSLWCIQEQPSQRPSMGKVVQMLEGVSAIDRPPAPKAADGGLAVVTSITIFATSSPAQPSMGSSHSIAGTSLVSKRNLDKPTSSMVVRAKKKDTGNVYALKIMDKKFIAKENKVSYVKMERIVLDQLDHPGIIRLCFTFQDTHSLYMALECCEGGELFDQITRKGYLSEDEARFYAAEVVDALEYIHGVGLIHRDIKPENLLLTADGHIKIADFGSVKPTRDSQMTVLPSSSNEKACTFVGTAAYVPPEVLNSCPATFANDLWALGCTLYQMLSGSSPFKDASEWLIFQRIITRDLKFPEFFSHEARDLIDKLLDTDPSKRPGAGPDGYASVKKHPFFNGVDWKQLRKAPAPRLALDHDNGVDYDSQDATWNLTHVGGAPSAHQHVIPDENAGATSSSETQSHISRLASIDSFDSRWQELAWRGDCYDLKAEEASEAD
ncbi:3-phosphoinositide-dependent protein kinase 1-like isoform X2 [Musa acuminata AAA Group]|uniref:3-phosphoinositide-dependent protein kinase 1-like isoform X2 n=2 Tax=Musa acuminata AAA Group TaxID=214697 RepID=UPI0031DAB88F